MAILLGFKNTSTSFSTNTTDGFENHNAKGTVITVLGEGKTEELEVKYKKLLKDANKAAKELDTFDNDEDDGEAYEGSLADHYKWIDERKEKCAILHFDNVLIVEGKTLK